MENNQIILKDSDQAISNKIKYTNMYQKYSCGFKDIGLCCYTLLVKEVNRVQKKKQACENDYLNKFQNELGLDPKTSSVTQEDNKEAHAIRQLLANNPLPPENELMEMPIEGS